MASVVAGHPLDTTEGVDKITSTDKITSAYFSDSVVQLSATDLHSASISDTNEVYYYGISKDNTTGSVQFNVAYGNSLGYGGDTGATADDIKSPTEVVYKHWANLLLSENEVTGGFFISSPRATSAVTTGKDTEIYIVNAKRSLMKDRLNKKNWTVVLSGSNTVGAAGAQLLHLTDDSNTVAATSTPAGPRYNIVSGSQGTVVKTATVTTGAYLKFRDEEDQTSVSYFCRVRSGESNFSNNPTFVSGSHNEIRQTTMKGNPTVYITGIGLQDSSGNIVAVGKLSTPLKKNFSSEATLKVKLTY